MGAVNEGAAIVRTTSDNISAIEAVEKAMEGVKENYQVTTDGRVFSTSSNWRGYGSRELIQHLNSNGYPSVMIAVGGARKNIAVHRLVALFHLPARPSPSHEIRHLDGNKANNSVKNLAWGTRSENALDRQRHGTERAPENAAKSLYKRTGELCSTAKLSNAEAVEIRQRLLNGESPRQVSESFPKITIWTIYKLSAGKTFKDCAVPRARTLLNGGSDAQ